MIRRVLLAASLVVLAAACGPAPSEPSLARPAAATRDGDPPPADTTSSPPADTTGRGGGGTIGSGT
jgi:hypothetical protein